MGTSRGSALEVSSLCFPFFVRASLCLWGGMQITLIVFAEENVFLRPTVTLLTREMHLSKKIIHAEFPWESASCIIYLEPMLLRVRDSRLRFIGRINEVPLSRQPWLVTWHWAEDKKERNTQEKRTANTINHLSWLMEAILLELRGQTLLCL
jgi:hypothetical protein